MVKSITSTYEAGRRGKSWRKVKPVRTLDLVVLAAEWGHGRRQGWLSNLHLGARDASEPGRFWMVGKTFKGMTDQLLDWQTAMFLERKVDETGITVHVRPELVVEIALDGVQVSNRYPGGVALRFARVKRYRPDKSPDQADTIDQVRQLLPRHLSPTPPPPSFPRVDAMPPESRGRPLGEARRFSRRRWRGRRRPGRVRAGPAGRRGRSTACPARP